MSDVVISPNMGLPVPIVGVDPGPDWATNIVASLGILDQHDHTAGRGVPVTPNGLNINTDLTIGSNNLTNVKTVRFTAQLAPLPGLAPDLGAIYVAGRELYYNDEVGNVVQITNAGSVNAGAGSITGLPSGTASASYSAGGQKFIWQSATSTAAGMDNGPVTIREQVPSANGITIQSPSSLAAPYSLTLFSALPGGTSFVTVDTSGNLGDSIPTSQGINTSNIANNAITTPLIADHNVTQAKLQLRPTGTTVAAGGIAVSASCGFFLTNTSSAITNLSVTITTTGRPVVICFRDDGLGGVARFGSVGAGNVQSRWVLKSNGAQICNQAVTNGNGGTIYLPPNAFSFIDLPAAGTYTYEAFAINDLGASADAENIVLIAYEQ